MPKELNRSVRDPLSLSGPLISLGLLILLALVLRLISLSREPLINPDGIVYILQAKAFYLQQADQFLKAYPYPTNLSLMIAGLFHLTGDWVLSGQLISLFFSLLTIIPLYLFNRVFWPRRTAIMVVALYVVSPVFVGLSHQIIRGPQFWFFLVVGLWGFCDFIERDDPPPYQLSLVAIAFILAAWSRIEGLLPFFIAGGWLMLDSRLRRFRYIAAYLLPVFLLLLIAGGLLLSHRSVPFDPLKILTHGVSGRLLDSIERFQWLRDALADLGNNPPPGIVPDFFDEARLFLWLLALGVTGHSIHKTFGNIFFLITFFGWLRVGSENTEKRRLIGSEKFLIVLIAFGIVFICLQIFLNWSSSTRFVALIYFPLLVFSGSGFNKLFFYWHRFRPGSSPALVTVLFCLVLVACASPSILKRSHLSQAVVFKEIGQELNRRHTPNRELDLCGTSNKISYSHFYATVYDPGLSLSAEHCNIIKVDQLKPGLLQDGGYDYLLLYDRDGGRQRFLQLLDKESKSKIVAVIEKKTKKYGTVSLFARRPPR